MIFGEKQSFAVECEFTSQIGLWLYGRFRVWVGGHPIGTYSEEVLTLACTTGVLRRPVETATPSVKSLRPQDLLDRVWAVVYGSGDYNEDEHRASHPYVWFDACEGFEPVRSVIAKIAGSYRIVWQLAGELSAQERYIAVQEYDSVVSSFNLWLDRCVAERLVGVDRGLLESGTAPNGGPAQPSANSGARVGPPSVS